jgi:hypothetical protein
VTTTTKKRASALSEKTKKELAPVQEIGEKGLIYRGKSTAPGRI